MKNKWKDSFDLRGHRPEPEWASQVERWYQLDSISFYSAELAWRLRSEIGHFDYLIGSGPQGSNSIDHAYAQRPSPSRFVYTLPSIRLSILCQIFDWHGPAMCLHAGSESLPRAIEEAKILIRDRTPKSALVLHVSETTSRRMDVFFQKVLS